MVDVNLILLNLVGNLINTLWCFDYELHVYRNLTKGQFGDVMTFYMTSFDFAAYDSFVLSLSSHGRFGEVTCSDNQHVSLQLDVINPMGQCRGLRGKPKHLWVQACQNIPSSRLLYHLLFLINVCPVMYLVPKYKLVYVFM